MAPVDVVVNVAVVVEGSLIPFDFILCLTVSNDRPTFNMRLYTPNLPLSLSANSLIISLSTFSDDSAAVAIVVVGAANDLVLLGEAAVAVAIAFAFAFAFAAVGDAIVVTVVNEAVAPRTAITAAQAALAVAIAAVVVVGILAVVVGVADVAVVDAALGESMGCDCDCDCNWAASISTYGLAAPVVVAGTLIVDVVAVVTVADIVIEMDDVEGRISTGEEEISCCSGCCCDCCCWWCCCCCCQRACRCSCWRCWCCCCCRRVCRC